VPAQSSKLERFDQALRSHYKTDRLVGVDEAGRGPLAGPVVAACVILPPILLPELADVRDSKRLSASKRGELFRIIRAKALGVGVGWALVDEIDERNILNATLAAMSRALRRAAFGDADHLVVIDGDHRIPGLPSRQEALVRGDNYSLCVASASIVAKFVRDRWMSVLDRKYPGYGFCRNMGYGTEEHRLALERLGPCPIHRRTFLSNYLEPSLPLPL